MAQEIADSTLLDTWASSGLMVEPDISKIIEGWQLGEQPPHEYMNWLQNTFGSKLNHILKNGIPLWESTKEYLAGATTQYNGDIWLSNATNTNSEPADVNANWKRIITVESLTTVLNSYVDTTRTQTIAGTKTFSTNPLSTASQSTNSNALTKYSAVVKNTGNETIAGVKTFSSSPIVPTPTTDFQTATKKYVDDNVGISLATANNYDLGVGQTWQDVTASRSANLIYTNSTGKPIQLAVKYLNSVALQISPDGLTWIEVGYGTGSTQNTFYPVVPDGWRYRVNGAATINYWAELR